LRSSPRSGSSFSLWSDAQWWRLHVLVPLTRVLTRHRIPFSHRECLSHFSYLRACLLVILFRVYILRPRTNPTTGEPTWRKRKRRPRKKLRRRSRPDFEAAYAAFEGESQRLCPLMKRAQSFLE